MINDDKKMEILYDHYKDTCLQVKEYIKLREKLFLYVIILIFILFVQFFLSGSFIEIINALIKKQIEFNPKFSVALVDNLLWFLLLAFVLRYFQTNVLINRQYSYLHSVESDLCKRAQEENFINREGSGYLKNYPIFSDWMHLLYTWIFPVLLLLTSVIKIVNEINTGKEIAINMIFDSMVFIIIFLSTLLYLICIHKN